jgi:predicted phosphodiesterase
MKVLLLGDVHGAHAEMVARLVRIRDLHDIGAVIQAGDFGFFPRFFSGGFSGGRLPVPVYAIDGNHDDHAWLHQMEKIGEPERWREKYNLFFQPRASVIRLGGATIGFLGGALHVDRAQYKHWFRNIANFIMTHERARATRLFNHEPPVMIVTHSCPSDMGVGIQGNPAFTAQLAVHVHGAEFDPGPDHDCGEVELTRLWRHLENRPQFWVFGHFHVRHDRMVAGTRFLCIDTLTSPDLLLWDTESGSISAIANPGTGT